MTARHNQRTVVSRPLTLHGGVQCIAKSQSNGRRPSLMSGGFSRHDIVCGTSVLTAPEHTVIELIG